MNNKNNKGYPKTIMDPNYFTEKQNENGKHFSYLVHIYEEVLTIFISELIYGIMGALNSER